MNNKWNLPEKPCGFGYKKISLGPQKTDTTDTFIGSAPSFSKSCE